jgi:hypothetical protein
MKKTEAVAAMDRIDQLIKFFGGRYEEEHREFKSLIFKLRNGSLQNPYFREKLSELETWATDGFSQRKWEKYTGGLQQVQAWAMGSADTARSLIEEHWFE